MKLELKHLAPYLPYGLKVLLTESNKTAEIFVLNKILFRHQIQIQTIYGTYGDMYFKPILRPLSDIEKIIEHNGEKFVPIEKLRLSTQEKLLLMAWGSESGRLTYNQSQKLFEWHFDVFGLIESRLAIDINTIEPKL